jgi:hypothetical protein
MTVDARSDRPDRGGASGEPSAAPGPEEPNEPSVVVSVPFGPPALGALAGAIRAVRAGDPLAPVTVVVPTAHAGVSVRRHLARLPDPQGRRGLVNVQWLSLPQVAELLAGPSSAEAGRPPLTDVLRRSAVRAVLRESPGSFAAVVGNPTTEESIDRVFGELRELEGPELSVLATLGPRVRDVVRLHERFRAACADFADPADTFELAVAAVEASASPHPGATGAATALHALGRLIVYVPARLSRRERRLLGALARVGRVTVIVGRTGDELADRGAQELEAQLGEELGLPVVASGAGSATSGPTTGAAGGVTTELVRAPDADEEVRVAVRRVLQALEEGTSPDDIAVVAGVASPYAVLCHEHLSVAGVPHHGPPVGTLAQSVAGRALLGFLGLARNGWKRSEVFRWVRSGPIRVPGGGRVSSRFDRLARQAGVAGGVDQWHQRLDRRLDELASDPAPPPWHGDRVQQVEDLRAFIDALVALAEPPSEPSWAAFGRWGIEVLDQVAGTRLQIASGHGAWPEAEQQAYDDLVDVLGLLGALDEVEPGVDAERFARVLEQELSRVTRRAGAFGHGVFVGSVDDLVGARHDLVVVLGMAEGSYPPRGLDDALIPDADRQRLGGALTDRRQRRSDDRRAHLAALASAPGRHLSFPRVSGNGASAREAMPARPFLRALSDETGSPVGFAELDRVTTPAFTDVPSFEAAVAGASPAVSAEEHAMAALLAGGAVPEPLTRGLAARRARRRGEFGEWTGDIGPDLAPVFDDERPGSATSFEQYATCPFRYFLNNVLGVRPLEEHADADAIGNLDRGSLVHEVLEGFVGEALGADSAVVGAAGADEHARLVDRVREVAADYERQGRTGRPLLWQIELDRLLQGLEELLEEDARHRRSTGLQPVAVEHGFGFGVGPSSRGAATVAAAAEAGDEPPAPPVTFTLPSGRSVSFRGSIDRVDRDERDGRLVVFDYKTGSAKGYADIEGGDITARGRHLQLVIYASAAQAAFGAGPTSAFYWFVELEGGAHRIGGAIDAAARDRFLDVLGTIVDGIESGRFPANPGDTNFFGWEHCGWCDYSPVCPTGRAELWEGVRLSGPLADYVALAEPERAVMPAGAPGDGPVGPVDGTDAEGPS